MARQEVLYGLIMALATVSSVSVGVGVSTESRYTLILATLGVNLAWGMADMGTFILTQNFEKRRQRSLAQAINMSSLEEDTMAWPVSAIKEDLTGTIVDNLDAEDREWIYLQILKRDIRVPDVPSSLNRDALLGGISSLLLTVFAALPVIVPLLILDSVQIGLWTGSFIAVILLFLTGYLWAPYAGQNRWKAGAVMMAVGGAITLAAVILGGG